MTVAEALAYGVRALEATSESPRLDAQLLLAHVLGQRNEWLIAHAEAVLSDARLDTFRVLCGERAGGKPIAYIVGSAGFHAHEFVVNQHVLIPRPETEHLVDDAIEYLKSCGDAATMLDVGTGSGAIAVAVAASVPNAIVDASDISPDAVAIARLNAQRMNVDSRVTFYQGDLVAPLDGERRYDVVVANLPYVPTNDIASAPASVSFEPRLALDGGEDGLDTYRRLLPELPPLLKPTALIILEAAPPTMAGLVALTGEVFPDAEVCVRRDYGGRERYITVRRPSTGSK